SGNIASCSFTVTIEDREAPILVCPTNVTTNTTSDCTQVVAWTTPEATDNCAVIDVICAPASGSPFALGVTTVPCTATDGSGNLSICSFTVTVEDTDLPSLICPLEIVTNAAPGQCSQLVIYTGIRAGNCAGASVSCIPPSGTMFTSGATEVQ